MSSPRNILSDSRDIYGALSGMPGSDSPSLTSNSDSNNNLFDKPIYPDNDETIDNVYDRKEKISSGEKARILDSDHRDGNVVYIVRAIIEDKKDKNLGSGFVMIQESKKKVEKKWYLPAGNVNRNESIEEALVRVVREETGLANGNPEQIISVEEIDPAILRHLKTEKDQYSIRAEVWKFEDLIRRQADLRDEDMLRAIRQYRSFSSSFPNVKSNSAFEKMSDKLSDYDSITTKWKKLKVEPISRDYITEYHDKQPWMLLHKRSKKVPIISCWSALADKCIHTAIFRFINQVHEQDYIHWYSYSTLGITCVENRKTDSPIGGQGLRMTVIFQMRNNNHQLGQKSKGNTVNEAREIPPIKQNSDYSWQQMPNCNETINLITTTPNKLPPLLSPRLIKTGHDKEIHLDQWHTNPLFSSTTKKYCENGTKSDVKDINMNETSLGSGRNLDEKSEWKRLLEEVFPSFDFIAGESFSLVKGTLECVDRRQNGFCGCIQRYILNRHDVTNLNSGQLSEQRLQRISMISFKSHKLKTERNPIAGRRYSDSFANHVSDHRVELSNYKLCKKAIASVLHCSLNFLYRDNNNKQKTIKKIEQIMAVPCCEKQCLHKLCTQNPDQVGRWRNKLEQKDSKSEDNRKVFFDLREHPLDPCIRAIGEITGLSKATLNNLSSKTRDTGIRHALQGRKRHPSNTETDRVRTFSNNSNSSIQSLNSASSIRTQSVIIPTPAVGYHYNGTSPSISLETPPPRSHISPKIKINGPPIDNLGMAKVEPIEQICVGSELPKLGNTQLLNDFDRQNLAEVIPIRPRLNAIKEEHADPEIQHLPKEDISPIEQYQPVYNEPISIEPLQKELTPSSVSPTIENSPGSNCDKPTKKRKAMPALKPLSDISDSSDPRSPQLRLPDVDTPSPFKKDKPDKPGSFKRLDSMGISSLALNTPTISPYTPSKFSTDKSCGSAQTPKSAHVFNFD